MTFVEMCLLRILKVFQKRYLVEVVQWIENDEKN